MNEAPLPERWNYFFKACEAVSVKGPTVKLPGGHAIVSVVEATAVERVHFTAAQVTFDLLPGQLKKLEAQGAAERHGRTWKDAPAGSTTAG
jgi:hypothetical protein